MSVLMTLRVQGDAAQVEHEDREALQGIVTKAKQHGLISHHFFGSEDEVLVVDEWPDEAAFHRFFEATPEIAGIFERAGVSSEPQVTFWRHLDTGDDVG